MPEESEDMWHAYNLITEGDYVRSTTIRKVQNETATGSSSSSRIRTMLTIAVETIDFDSQACVLRLKGRNIAENQYVKVCTRFGGARRLFEANLADGEATLDDSGLFIGQSGFSASKLASSSPN